MKFPSIIIEIFLSDWFNLFIFERKLEYKVLCFDIPRIFVHVGIRVVYRDYRLLMNFSYFVFCFLKVQIFTIINKCLVLLCVGIVRLIRFMVSLQYNLSKSERESLVLRRSHHIFLYNWAFDDIYLRELQMSLVLQLAQVLV